MVFLKGVDKKVALKCKLCSAKFYIMKYKLVSDDIKTTRLILCRFPLCHQNSSDSSGHERGTPGVVLWVLWVAGCGFHGSALFRCMPRLDWDLAILEAGSKLGLFVIFFKLFLNAFCSMAMGWAGGGGVADGFTVMTSTVSDKHISVLKKNCTVLCV